MQKILQEAIDRQKREHAALYAARQYTPRTKLAHTQAWLASDLIKVIMGPRRAGKSVFASLMLSGVDHAYFNFEDETVASLSEFDSNAFMRELAVAYGPVRTLFFDEIQNVPHWEAFINRLHREGYNITVTGSNARLLSRELATSLTGRHIPIELLPYSFSELLAAKQIVPHSGAAAADLPSDVIYPLLDLYLESGGYPEIVEKELAVNSYLDILFDALLYADVVKRYRLRHAEALESLGVYLINNIASRFTLRRLTDVLGFKSPMTVETYLSHLTDAYLLYTLQPYSHKTGTRLRAAKKAYVVDNGFLTAKAVRHAPDRGIRMENLVFTELVKRGAVPNRTLFYYETRGGKEVDFMLRDGTQTRELLQVAYDVSDERTRDREEGGLVFAAKELGCDVCTIVSWDHDAEVERDGYRIRYIALPRWLLEHGNDNTHA